MQITLRPDGLLERVALWFNLGPTPVALAFFGMMSSRAAMAGVRLGIFAELANGPRTAAGVAAQRGLSPEGAFRLLQALAILELVHFKNGEFHLPQRSRRWLDPRSESYVGDFLEFNYAQWEWWSNLEDAIRTGRGPDIHSFPAEDPRWDAYVKAMFQLARLAGPEVVSHLKLDAPKSLLDIGGSHGWFSELLCRKYPTLKAEVMELPGALEAGRRLLEKEGKTRRVQHQGGHAGRDSLGEGRDAILLFQVLHHLDEAASRTLLAKIHAALRPGGLLAINEYFADLPGSRPDGSALLALHYFLTSSAAAYPEATVLGWIRDAGFTLERNVRLRRIPFARLLLARRR